MRICINQNILRLNVSVTNAFGVDVGYRSEQLVRVDFDQEIGHHLLHFEVLLHNPVRGVGDVVHDHIQVHFIGLVTVGIEGLAHLYTIRMMEHFKNLQLSVLVSFILEDLLDGHSLTGFGDGGLENDTEGAISNNLLGIVCE